MKLKGAQVVIECLREQGVNIVFGFPGGAILPVYDALYDAKDITHILTAHEQGATHAADGYARATGKVGVVFATSGPGATNTVTGIATAYMDSVPLVVFTGQVASSLLGKDSFQEVDITGITAPITKHNYIVKDAQRLPDIIRQAFKIARSGRPGPVLVDIPRDIQNAVIDYQPVQVDTSYVNEDIFHPQFYRNEQIEKNIQKAAEAINKCERPVIYAGGGVNISGANHELVTFAEKIKAPVTCSLMGLGAFPGTHPYFMGMVGMHGTRVSNYAVSNCDLLIAVGARFSDRVVSKADKFATRAKIIHIDIDPAELGKNIDVHIPICGDVKKILQRLIELVDEKQPNSWNKQIEDWKRAYTLKHYTPKGKLSPQFIIEKLYALTAGKAIITTEVGQNQMWTAQFYKFDEPRTFISSGGLGTMGYGLGAAIGACIGRPDRRVINVAGDGSFKMNSTELATVSRYKLPIIQLVLNNQALGMVRQWQRLFYNGRFSYTTLGPDVDFVKLADAYGIKGFRITSNEEVEDTLKQALEMQQPVLIECIIHPDEMVYPMVPPGAPIDEVID
ncbi:acetolactate synthase-1/2/3 large subunit [Caldicoprobacter guelmensis]|uniref:biosynthetic-type acetolactate synthase large subunit n=1 Tax=Caldicoprobacter guelmensis TaxID=1170224 RepID=UPI0019578876|nr:acetolactate synthase-1/2/3 large subunit [Caldicoprobacter guelmensis]